MVLENPSASSEVDFSENPPSSDIDPYAASNPAYTATRPGGSNYVPVNPPGQNQVFVDLGQLPRNWSFLGEARRPPELVDGIQASCKFASNVLKRPVRQEEADALAYHFAHSIRIGSYGTPIGITLGSIQNYRSWRTYRFPGWTPFKEGSSFSADVFGPLRGQSARIAWQSTRGIAYAAVGATLGKIFFGSYALKVAAAGRAMDPRLKEFVEALKQKSYEGQSLESLRRPQDEGGTTQSETFEQGRQRRAVQQVGMRSRQQQAASRKGEDDMSPTGGAFGSEYSDFSSDTGLMSDEQMRQQEIGQRVEPSSSPTQSRDNTFGIHKAAPQQPSSSRSSANQSTHDRQGGDQTSLPRQSSGSAWDRLRQGAMSGQARAGEGQSSQPSGSSGMPTRVRGEQRTGSTVGDSFSFSESEEERQLAKSEAQRQFDKRIEREREGRDFDDSGGGRRRW